MSADLVCGDTDQVTLISALQGAGANVTTVDFTVVEGIVTHNRYRGFYLQEEPADSDNDADTSEAIWVLESANQQIPDVGTTVRVGGFPQEYYGLSQLTMTSLIVCDASNKLDDITPIDIGLPLTADIEPYEGMLATVSNAVIVSLDDFTRYGEIDLSNELRWTPSDVAVPLSAEYDIEVAKNAIPILKIDDDGSSYPDEISYYPMLNYSNAPRIGDTVSATGPMSYGFDNWRILADSFTLNSMRPVEDITRSDVSIASYNVLNYFNGFYNETTDTVTFDYSENRGADNVEQFELQQARIVATLLELDGDVITLSEMENDGFGERSAIKQLTDALNDAIGRTPGFVDDTYEFVAPASLDNDDAASWATGTDDITNAIIYKSAVVSPVGNLKWTAMPTQRDANGDFVAGMRNALTQTFRYIESGDMFVVSANHFKSKGSSCLEDDEDDATRPEEVDIQGSCNALRVSAAVTLAEDLQSMVPSLPAKQFIVGDLNCYTSEDPMAVLTTLAPGDGRR